MELNINKDSQIDIYSLDKEAKVLPSTMARYQEAITEQMRLVDNLKIRLTKEEAVARIDARRALSVDGNKPTQATVDDTVSTLSAIVQLRKELAEEERELSYLKGCMSILDTKRKSLDNLVQLWVSRFYGEAAIDRKVMAGNYAEADAKRIASTDYNKINEEETNLLNERRKEK